MADDDTGGWTLPTPAFNADEALVALRRQLRELRPLAERGTRYELQGRPVIELAVVDGRIDARLAKRPATTPEWQRHALASAAELRRFVDAVRQALRRWEHED
jgi:hypothetical protein